MFLKQSTSHTFRVGPFKDDTDGKTNEESLTINQAHIRLSKAGGDYAQSNDSGGGTHDEDGHYSITLDATDTNTVGMLDVAIDVSGALAVWRHFFVLPANVYDALVGSDRLEVDMMEINGNASAAQNMQKAALGIVTGAAVTGTLSQTQMSTDLTEVTADHMNGRTLIFTSGVLAGQATDIEDYATDGTITYKQITEAPSNGDTFVIM